MCVELAESTNFWSSMNDKRKEGLRILMIGPALHVQGGISTLEQLLIDFWPEQTHSLRFVGTLVDGSQVAKLVTAIHAFLQFLAALITYRPHILYVHFSSRASFYRKAVFVLMASLARHKIVMHGNGSEFHIFYEQESGRWRQAFIRFVLNRAQALIVVSDQWREFYREIYDRSEPIVIYNAMACPDRAASLTESPPVILALGRLGQRKGSYDLLSAFPHILEKFPEAQLWLGGDGEVAQVDECIRQQSWSKQVKLLGWVTGEAKEQVLRQSWLFALPSYNEGLPLAILEAMGYGLPVISTPVGGIPEAVVDGVTGFLVTPGDVAAISEKLQLLLADHECRQKMGLAARQRILDRFEVRKVIDQIIAVFEKVG
jgi:glycosyltransferase involved in cell wall biosynthesis